MRLPTGTSDFRKIIENPKLSFVDKSLLIKDMIDDTTEVVLFTRPRRFGKTINLSMLQHYFSKEVQDKPTRQLFDGLLISRCGDEYLEHQGKYPVIFLSFKDVKDGNFKEAYAMLVELICDAYEEHRYLLDSNVLKKNEKKLFNRILDKEATQAEIKKSIKKLTNYLHRYFGVKPILLIDEYDTPIQSGYMEGYYKQIISFMRHLFGAALKDNSDLHKAVLTGILRVSKESLFSGLNNIKVYSLLSDKYSEYFGFTEKEVNEILKGVKLEHTAKEIKAWYNGYQIGNTVIYNPWSIANCVDENGDLKPYWINTSDNALIKLSIMHSGVEFKTDFENLLQHKPSEQLLPEYFVFDDLEADPTTLWSLMLEAGYLKALNPIREASKIRCQLLSPNEEIMALLTDTVKDWFQKPLKGERYYHEFLNYLITGNVTEFTAILQRFLENGLSYFDTKGKHPEKFYHGFVLGLIVSLEKTHTIKSNRESGYGRYDVMIIPKDKKQLGLIIEFKNSPTAKAMQQTAKEAMKQINDKNYEAELRQMKIKSILKLAMAFHNKKVVVLHDGMTCN